MAVNVGARAQRNFALLKAGHLRQSQPSLDGRKQKGVVSTSQPCFLIRRRQQSIDFRAGEKIDHRSRVPLIWNGKNTLDDPAVCRRFQCGVAKE